MDTSPGNGRSSPLVRTLVLLRFAAGILVGLSLAGSAAAAPGDGALSRQEEANAEEVDFAAVEARFREADAAHRAGKNDEALEKVRAIVAQVGAPGVIDSPAADRLLWNSGILLRRCGAEDDAIDAQALVAERRARLEADDPQRLYDAHYSVAYYAEKARRFADAARHFKAAYAAGTELRAPDDAQLLEIRSRAGRSLYHAHRPREAAEWTRATLQDNLRLLGPGHTHVRQARNDLSFVLTELGEYDEALALNDQALAELESVPDGERHHAWLVQQRGDLQRRLGQLDAALASHREALAGFEAQEPVRPESIQLARQRIGVGLKELGRFDEALRELEATLEYAREVGEDDAETTVTILRYMAGTHLARGDVPRARALYESVLELAQETFPEGHATRVEVLDGLASCKLMLGEVESALELFERELDALVALYGEEHPYVASSRSNLALALSESGRVEEAREYQRQVLAAHALKLGDDHPKTTLARLNLAAMELRSGDFERAFELAEPAVALRREQLAAHDPALLQALATLASACARTGRAARALALFQERYAALDRTRPPHDVETLGARQDLLEALVDAGRSRQAEALAETQLRSIREAVRVAVASSSAGELEALSARLRAPIARILEEMRAGLGALDAEFFTTLETLRAASSVASALSSLDGGLDTRPSEAERAAARALARAVRNAAAADEIADLHRRLETLRRERQERLAAQPGASRLLEPPSPAAVGTALGGAGTGDSVALAFHVHRVPPTPRVPAPVGELVVHIVTDDGALRRLALGSLDEIVEAASEWRATMGVRPGGTGLRGAGMSPAPPSGTEDERSAGARLRALVWDPLAEHVEGAERVLVVPDGPLLTVPLDALPVEGGRLGDGTRLEQRATLHEVLWTRAAPEDGILLAFGGVAFASHPLGPDAPDPEDGEVAPPSGASPVLRGSPWEAGFADLHATGGEVRELAALAEELDVAEAHLFLGARASRETVESLAHRARYFHVATHGWFSSSALERRGSSAPAGHLPRAEHVRSVSPMALCGVALAGANLPPDELGRAPGLVTAEEIASWDLRRCELAVLSACETAVGIVDDGTGAASLQKAFHLAGARTVVASLWQVPDEPTRELMAAFYRRLWSGTPKARALWEAKVELRDRRGPDGRPLYRARDWAAWVLTGEPE